MSAEAPATGPSVKSRRSRSPALPRASFAKSARAAEALLALVVDYANGMTQAEIAKKHGINVQTLRKRLQKAGVNTGARVRLLSSAQVEAARSAIAEGASLRATARQLDVSHTTLLRNLQKGRSRTNHHCAPVSDVQTPPQSMQITIAHHQEKPLLTSHFMEKLCSRLESRGKVVRVPA